MSLSVITTLAVFLGYLCLSIVSSFVLAQGVDKISARLNLTQGLFGMFAALTADSPEISSAVIALLGGHHDLSLSVVFGSNIFNLAALLGLSAIISKRVEVPRSRLLLNGLAGSLILAAVVGLLLGYLSLPAAVTLTALVFIPYVFFMGLQPKHIRRFLPLGWLRDFLCDGLSDSNTEESEERVEPKHWKEMLVVVPALATIIFASRGLVNTSLSLAETWNIDDHIVGVLVLATLTGIPNVIASLRLARNGRGTAVVSEALNSNTFNLFAGICLPALMLGLQKPSQLTIYASWWLLGMTAITIALTAFQHHLGRLGGACLIFLYLLFAGLVFFYS